MNLKDTLESLIAQAMADDQELIPVHELPAAKVIAQRIEALEKALKDCAMALEKSSPAYEWDQQNHLSALVNAENLLE